MSFTTRLVELERKHTTLDKELTKELTHANRDETRIAVIKRQKLAIKDEITRLRQHKPEPARLH